LCGDSSPIPDALCIDSCFRAAELVALASRQLHLERNAVGPSPAVLLRTGVRGPARIAPQTAWSGHVSASRRNFLRSFRRRDLRRADQRGESERIVDTARSEER